MIDTVIDALARKPGRRTRCLGLGQILVRACGCAAVARISNIAAGCHRLDEIRLLLQAVPCGQPRLGIGQPFWCGAGFEFSRCRSLTSWHTRLALGHTVLDDIVGCYQQQGSSGVSPYRPIEELFRYACRRAAKRPTLIELLCLLASVAVTLFRSFSLCARTISASALASMVSQRRSTPARSRLNDFGLLRAIHEPAELYGGKIDPAVGDRLLFAVRQGEDALPVLQHALTRAAPTRGSAMGPARAGSSLCPISRPSRAVRGLSRHADEVLAEIQAGDPMNLEAGRSGRSAAATELDAEGRGGIRRPRILAELIAVAGGGDRARMIAVIEAFQAPKLQTSSMTNPPGPLEETTEIEFRFTEVLIRCWQRLSDPTRDPVRNEPVGWVRREFEDGQRWRALAVQYMRFPR